MRDSELKRLLKRVVELAMPDLRSYYRMVRKAKVVKTYASNGQYWADVQPLRNDENVDAKEPVISRVEIPILWAGPSRGVVCPPVVGALCDLSYYDGDPAFPRISNFRWKNNQAPGCELEAFIIQKGPGISIKIDAEDNIRIITSASVLIDAPAIRMNSGTGVVTGECICHFTGTPHGDVSATVFAGKQ
ncbi:MAG: hypothetical protein ABIK15_07335 [Pseudomonadota bacterium]